MRPLERHYSIKEAAALLGVPGSTLRMWALHGMVARVKFPGRRGRVLIRESDLAELLARLREPAATEIRDDLLWGERTRSRGTCR